MQRTLPNPIRLPNPPKTANPRDLQAWAIKMVQQLEQHIYDMREVMNTGGQGFGDTLASAAVITPSAYHHDITGTATITTINTPLGATAPIVLRSVDGFSLGPGGNIAIGAATKITPPNYAQLVYDGREQMWHVTNTGGPFSPDTLTAHALLVGEGSSAVSSVGPLSDGQLVIGVSGADPVAAAVAAGLGINITNGPGSISIANTGIITVTGTANEIVVTPTPDAQHPVLSLPGTVTGPTRYTGLAAPSATGDALSEGNPIGAKTPAAVNATQLALSPLTFATLPAAPAAGTICYITDCNTNVWGANAAGGGTNKVLVWWNGTNWTVFAK